MEPVGQPDVKVHGVGEVLWQRLVDLQCRELQKVTAMTKMLDDLGLKEEATQLRGWLVCQSLSGKYCFDSVFESCPITSILIVISELYQKGLFPEDDQRRLPHYPYMMGYSSRHWLDSLVDIQSSKSADVHARTFAILRKYSLTEVGNKTQAKHTGETIRAFHFYDIFACTDYKFVICRCIHSYLANLCTNHTLRVQITWCH